MRKVYATIDDVIKGLRTLHADWGEVEILEDKAHQLRKLDDLIETLEALTEPVTSLKTHGGGTGGGND